MPRFKDYSYDQQTMLAIDFRRQILPGSFEWAINRIVDTRLDLSVFESRFRNDVTGAPAFDPAILLKIVLLAYARGILSSRQIEAACRENIVFMALSADSQPHFTTIARFVASMSEVIEPLFTDVLLYCDELGLIQGEMFAVDGCKLPSNAGKQHSGKIEELSHRRDKLKARAQRLLDVHARTDQQDHNGSGDEADQAARIAKLDKEVERIDRFLATAKKRLGPGGREVKSNRVDNTSAKMNTSHGTLQGYNGLAAVDAGSQVVVHAEAIGQGPENDRLLPMLDGVEQQLEAIGRRTPLKDCEITADSGFHSTATLEALEARGIDALVADKDMRKRDERFADRDKHKVRHRLNRQRQAKAGKAARPAIYSVSDFDYNAESNTCHCPAGNKLYSDGSNTTLNGYRTQRFRGSKASCLPCDHRKRCLQNPDTTQTKQVSILLEKRDQGENALERMKRKIDSPAGRRSYSRRLGTVEPVFGNHRNHRRDHFTLRTQRKVDAQWRLFNLVHNIGKCQTSGLMAA